MKIFAPKYYKDFVCIAEKCKHSCCIGWEIDIDNNTIDKYESLNDDFKIQILTSIDFSEQPHFKLALNDRCPHLNENGLCKIIKNVGEEYLCDICREHPRFYNYTNCGKEVGIGMSCEEACRIILNSDDFDSYVLLNEDEKIPEIIDFDALAHRETVFKIIKDRNLAFEAKIDILCDYFDLYFDEKTISKIIPKLEYLKPSHKEIFMKFSLKAHDANISLKIERALAYFVYRHCTEAESFDEFSTALSLAIFCTYLISSISSAANIEDMARIVSEEIEYSQDNIELIKSLF